jgi:hypothetical protein
VGSGVVYDPAVTGLRDQVAQIERYAELVISNDVTSPADRVMAERVLRQAKGLWRLLDRWRTRRGPAAVRRAS